MSKTAKTTKASSRRAFLNTSTALLGTVLYTGTHTACSQNQSGMAPRLKVSLAQWSLHRALRAGEAGNLDFPQIARKSFGFDAVEWSNHFFYEKHDHFKFEKWFGLFGWFGFIAYVSLVLMARVLRKALKREEDYYYQ